MATMPLSLYLSTADLDANRRQLAAAIDQHPLSLQLSHLVIAALSDIATGIAPPTPADRRLLRQALATIDLAEVEISRRAA
jgi:hypothetical protein